MPEKGYIHGTSAAEQQRLYEQARYLEPMVFAGVSFPARARLIEPGCGVGAETEVLLRRFPGVRVEAVDRSPEQVAQARRRFAGRKAASRVRFSVGDAAALPFPPRSFDGAFVCWLLEHVPAPLAVLKELRRVLRPGAVVHGIEVMNSSLVLSPEAPAVRRVWDLLNARQRKLGGDPDVGPAMGNLLKAAGFRRISAGPYARFHDQRDKKDFTAMMRYWERLILSAVPDLKAAGLVNAALLRRLKADFARLRRSPAGLAYYSPIKFSARA
jgi:ubiquinone/menaquinone biosynthesis C-methylase UbiE